MPCANNEHIAWDASPEAGTRKTLEINGVEFPFRYCPPGTFAMGSPEDEEGRVANEVLHEVTLTRGFWLLETPVTQRMYEAITGENPSNYPPAGPDYPVEEVTQRDAVAFCETLNALNAAPTGFAFRLPWEAEWERACRAGTSTAYWWGDALNGDRANVDGSDPCGTSEEGPFVEGTTPVGSYDANPWGLFDMHGNVWEWCADACDRFVEYDAAPQIDPFGATEGEKRILRGGSWDDGADAARSAYRHLEFDFEMNWHIGFRVALGRED